jgi:tetratricopeptide (TPR) repeat protein
MSTDWFRNEIWNDQVAATFEAKLQRARRKEQYLRIQASTLAKRHPEVALALLERYFQFPEQFDAAQAYVDRAYACLALERVPEAIDSFERALAREAVFPNSLTQAYIELPFSIASRHLAERYGRALELLSLHRKRLMFPVDLFKWNASRALIAKDVGEPAFEFARAALQAAETRQSGFQRHQQVGLVGAALLEVENEMRRLCAV